MLHGFPPVSDPKIDTLILGSMPGRDSLNASQYYAHGRNAFWPIMSELFGASPSLSYTSRIGILLENGVGIWDVIQSCRRKTSLDSAIEERSIIVNDFALFFKQHPRVKLIFFNGGKAAQSFNRYIAKDLTEKRIQSRQLPSTSPANARMNFQQKLSAWSDALQEND